MLLENKVAVVYGAGGAVGRAAARTFAREGASVQLAGRTKAKLDAVAESIDSATVGRTSPSWTRSTRKPSRDIWTLSPPTQAGST